MINKFIEIKSQLLPLVSIFRVFEKTFNILKIEFLSPLKCTCYRIVRLVNYFLC